MSFTCASHKKPLFSDIRPLLSCHLRIAVEVSRVSGHPGFVFCSFYSIAVLFLGFCSGFFLVGVASRESLVVSLAELGEVFRMMDLVACEFLEFVVLKR